MTRDADGDWTERDDLLTELLVRALRELDVDEVPLNFLVSIEGTKLEEMLALSATLVSIGTSRQPINVRPSARISRFMFSRAA